MKSSILRSVSGLVIIAIVPTLALNGSVSAQSYGERVYGGGVYNDSRKESDNKDRNETATPPDNIGTSGHSPATDEVEIEDQSSEAATDLDDTITIVNNSNDYTRQPSEESSSEEESSGANYWAFASLAALVLALIIFISLIARKRRRAQQY